MAKGNLILGTMSGKLGDVVAYTNNGKQCARVRRRVVANPNSAGQQVQRMILTTAAQAVSALRPILNNAFEGIQKGAPSLAYARKIFMSQLRTENMYQQDNGLHYVMKGGKYFAPNEHMISRGSLPIPSYIFDGNSFRIQDLVAVASATATASEAFPFAAIGMQHTFVFCELIAVNDSQMVSVVHTARVVFKDDTTPCFVADGDNFKINAAAVDTAYSSNWDKLSFSNGVGVVQVTLLEGTTDPIAAGYILSTRDGSKRSTSYLRIAQQSIFDEIGTFSPDAVVDSYDNSGVDSGAPAEYLLDDNPGGSF